MESNKSDRVGKLDFKLTIPYPLRVIIISNLKFYRSAGSLVVIWEDITGGFCRYLPLKGSIYLKLLPFKLENATNSV